MPHSAPHSTRCCSNFFNTIRSKILLAFVVMCVITACLGFYAARGLRQAGDLVVETFDKSLMSINYARAAATDFAGMETGFARRRATTDPELRRAIDDHIAESAETLAEDLGIAAERAQSAPATRAAHEVQRAATAWQAAAQRGDWTAVDAAAVVVATQIDLLINFTAGDGFTYRQRALAQIASQTRLNVAGTVAALLLAALTTFLLARRIMGPVAAASAAAARIARGELNTAIPTGGGDELGALLGAMVVMRDNIRTMMENEIAQRQSAQARLLDAIESSSEGVLLVDSDGLIVIANSQLATFFPLVAELLKPGLRFDRLVAAVVERGCFAPARRASAGFRGWLATRGPSAVEQLLADGRWLRISRSATRDEGVVLLCGDITDSKQHEAELELTNLWFSTALNNMSQGLLLFDAQDRLRVVNRRFADMFGVPHAELRPGLSFRDMVDLGNAAGNYVSDHVGTLYRERVAVIAQGQPQLLLRELADGRQLTISHQPMPDGGWVATYEDITERRRAEAQIAFMAHHDALTGLANRVQLSERIEQALGLPQPLGDPLKIAFAVLCLDLDQFKSVNDTLGHHCGDLLLGAVAERLRGCVSAQDLVARLGGDEFAILLLAREGPGGALLAAQRILAALAEPFEIDGHPVVCATSMGIVVAPGDGASSETLLKNADIALYRAKADGRGIYRFFEPEMDARLQARRTLELDLRAALENHGFQLFYQPLIEVQRERICGFEALLRWPHPTRGMVSPAEFVPIAEESGLILKLGEWVLREACREAASWPDHIKVAVNVSPLQFRSPRLVEAVVEALQLSGLPARRLDLEITESVLLHESEAVMATLRRLHDLGLRISMDDFGTGYSSLSYLRSFPFDKIKIDQSFIRDLATKAESRAIVRAIVGLGISLGMRTTAEGVEDADQLAILRAEGCTEIQGYYYSRPKPPAELPALMARWGGAPQLAALAQAL